MTQGVVNLSQQLTSNEIPDLTWLKAKPPIFHKNTYISSYNNLWHSKVPTPAASPDHFFLEALPGTRSTILANRVGLGNWKMGGSPEIRDSSFGKPYETKPWFLGFMSVLWGHTTWNDLCRATAFHIHTLEVGSLVGDAAGSSNPQPQRQDPWKSGDKGCFKVGISTFSGPFCRCQCDFWRCLEGWSRGINSCWDCGLV